jgi:hypothetical protein
MESGTHEVLLRERYLYARVLNLEPPILLMKSSRPSIDAYLKSKSRPSGTAQFESRWKHQNVSRLFSSNFSISSDLSDTLSKKHTTGQRQVRMLL